MKYFLLAVLFIALSCRKPPTAKPPARGPIVDKSQALEAEKPTLPKGAIRANFDGSGDSLYVFVKEVDSASQTTLLGFEGEAFPELSIPESHGAQLQLLKLKKFPNDLLVVQAKGSDTNFNDYYLFVWQDSLWKQPVNRFYIHKANMNDSLRPIMDDPSDSTKVLRYYSVFDIDPNSEKKYSWRLMRESVPLEE